MKGKLTLKILLTCIAAFTTSLLWSCDPPLYDFQESVCEFNEATILFGTVVSKSENSADLEIISVLRGCELRSVIRIFDGSTVECNGPFTAPADLLGEVGDSVIFLAQKINTIENPWDRIGDYRRPEQFNYVGYKKVINNQALISRFNEFVQIEFEEYLSLLEMTDCLESEVDCFNEAVEIFPNPSTNTVFFKEENFNWSIYKIFDASGKTVGLGVKKEGYNAINVLDIPAGVYFITLFGASKKDLKTIKFLKL